MYNYCTVQQFSQYPVYNFIVQKSVKVLLLSLILSVQKKKKRKKKKT